MSKKLMFDMNWDVDKYKSKYDPEHWGLCRSFMIIHKSKYAEQKLVNLTEAFYQIGVYGSSYDEKTTRMVSALTIEVLEELLQSHPGVLRHPFNSLLPESPQGNSNSSSKSSTSKENEGTKKTNPTSIWDVNVDQTIIANVLTDADLQTLLKGFVIIYDVSKVSTMIDNKITILEESFKRSKFGPCHWDKQDTNNQDSPIRLALKWKGTVLAEAVGADYKALRLRLAQAILSKIAKFSPGIEAKWNYYRDGRKPDVFDNPNPRKSSVYKVLAHSQLRTMAEITSFIDTFANSDSFAELIFGLDFSNHERKLIEEYVIKAWGTKLWFRTVNKLPGSAAKGGKSTETHLCVSQVRTGDEMRRWLEQCGGESERYRLTAPGNHRRAGLCDENVKETLTTSRVEPPTVDLTDDEPISKKSLSSENKNVPFKAPNTLPNKPINQPANKQSNKNQKVQESPTPLVQRAPPKNMSVPEGDSDDLENILNGFVLLYNVSKNSKIDKDDWLTALCESFNLSNFGSLEVICDNVRPLRTRCELKWKGRTLASAEGLTETQARTAATLQLISKLEPFTYIIQAKEEYFFDGKVPEFVEDQSKNIDVCRVMNRKDLPSYYSIFQTIDTFSNTPSYQEMVFGSDFTWELKEEIVVYVQAKGMDFRYFTSGKGGDNEHPTHMAVYHTIDPFKLKSHLLNCGGETEKYKIIPPSKAEPLPIKTAIQKTTKAVETPSEKTPAKKVEETPTTWKVPAIPPSQTRGKSAVNQAQANPASKNPAKPVNEAQTNTQAKQSTANQGNLANQTQIKPANQGQAKPANQALKQPSNQFQPQSTNQAQTSSNLIQLISGNQDKSANQAQTKPANQAQLKPESQAQEKPATQAKETPGKQAPTKSANHGNKIQVNPSNLAPGNATSNQTLAKHANQPQAKAVNEVQAKPGNQAPEKATLNKENTPGNKSLDHLATKAAEKRKLAEKEKEAALNTIQIKLKKFKKDTVEYPEDTGGEFPGLILWIGIRRNSTWQRSLFHILLESFKMSKYGELNVEELEEAVWGRKDPMKKCVIKSGRKVLAVGLGETKAEAKHSAAQQVLRRLRKHCYTIQVKETYFKEGKATPYDFTPDPTKENFYKVLKRDKMKDRASMLKCIDEFSKKVCDEEIIFGDDFSYEEREHILEHCRRTGVSHRTMKCQSAAKGMHTHVAIYHQRPLPKLKAALVEAGGQNDKYLLILPGGKITIQASVQPTTEDMWPETLVDQKQDTKSTTTPGQTGEQTTSGNQPAGNQNPNVQFGSQPSPANFVQTYPQDLQMAANMGFGLVPVNAVPYMPYQEMPLVFGAQPPMVYLPIQPNVIPMEPVPTEEDLRKELERKRQEIAEKENPDRQVFDSSEERKVVRKQDSGPEDWSRKVFVDDHEKKRNQPEKLDPGKSSDLRDRLRNKDSLKRKNSQERVFRQGEPSGRGKMFPGRGRGRRIPGERSPGRKFSPDREFRRFSPVRDDREKFREEKIVRRHDFGEERRIVHDSSMDESRGRFRSGRSPSPRRNFREDRRVRSTSPVRRFRDLWDNIDERFSKSIFMYKYVKQDSCTETDPYSLLRATRSLDFNVDFDFITNQISPDEWEVAVELVTDDTNIHPLVGEGIGETESGARYTAALHAVDTIQKACRVIEPNRGYFVEGGVPEFIARKFPMKTHIYEIIQNLDPSQPLDRYTVEIMFNVFHDSVMEDLFFLSTDFSYLERVLVIEMANKMNLWWRLFGPRHPDAPHDDLVSTQHVCVLKQKSALILAKELLDNGGSTEKFTLVDPRVSRITRPHWPRRDRY